MSQATLTSPPRPGTPQPSSPGQPLPLGRQDRLATTSIVIAWCLIAGLPTLGVLAALVVGLPAPVAVTGGCVLAVTGLLLRQAVTTFTNRVLHVLVAARCTVVVIVGALLFAVTGSAWMALAGAVFLGAAADRLPGWRTLCRLWKLARDRR